MPVRTSIFWIAGNIFIDTSTGATNQVLMLVNQESDATVFDTETEARNYLLFVKNRIQNIQWFLDEPTPIRPQGWVIRGVQTKTTAR
jgi:hypothetical protein